MPTKKVADHSGLADTVFHTDDYGNIEVIERVQDVSEVLKQNEIMRNNWDGYSPSKDTRHVAEVPVVVWEHLVKQGIADDPKRLRAWLNDPDNRMFRVTDGKVG